MSTSGGSSGGSTAGAQITRKFAFAFNTPNILTGATLYTPTVGDILHDAWISITTAWDGTTPFGDVGTFTTVGMGIIAENMGQAVNMDSADSLFAGMSGMLAGTSMSEARDAGVLSNPTANAGSAIYQVALTNVNMIATPVSNGFRTLPGKFTAATAIKVVVSQDGTKTGASPGSTVGAATLYLVTSTPT